MMAITRAATIAVRSPLVSAFTIRATEARVDRAAAVYVHSVAVQAKSAPAKTRTHGSHHSGASTPAIAKTRPTRPALTHSAISVSEHGSPEQSPQRAIVV